VSDEKNQIIAVLQLIRTEKIGAITFFKLLSKYGTPKNIIANLQNNPQYNFNLTPIHLALEEYQKTIDSGASFVLYSSNLYPELLQQIPDKPPLLTVLGNTDLLNKPKISIVGPRNSSHNGNNHAKQFAKVLGNNGFVCVSGLANGVDSEVHKASIISGTIAVLPCGINIIYPLENKFLYHEIIKYGLLISEFAYGFTPKSYSFIQRNRIVSGLSLATIVAEASISSGSLLTARFALEQNREVFAVPGSISDPRYYGTNQLIKQGANILTSINDVLTSFNISNIVQEEKKTKIQSFIYLDNELKQQILNYINFNPISIEELVQVFKVPIQQFNVAISELELADKIKIEYNKITKI
jgi:DNA processing protein